MKTEFVEYLKSIGVTDVLMPRIDYFLGVMTLVAKEEIQDIFVSEYVQDDNTRYYETIRGFTENFCVSAARFLQEELYVLWKLNKFFNADETRLNIETENYNFISATPSSRLTFRCYIFPGTSSPLIFQCSGLNCQYFYDKIYNKYIYPRLRS